MQQIDLSAINDTESIYRLIGSLMQDNREFQVMITVPSKENEHEHTWSEKKEKQEIIRFISHENS